ncbi:hypothetical protein HMPREF2534_01324 [Bacteroides thetaiotaomicron]|nr:hypothetical protein HMPREF2534_01324 [Bacteroides thetaiotaomicron]
MCASSEVYIVFLYRKRNFFMGGNEKVLRSIYWAEDFMNGIIKRI